MKKMTKYLLFKETQIAIKQIAIKLRGTTEVLITLLDLNTNR